MLQLTVSRRRRQIQPHQLSKVVLDGICIRRLGVGVDREGLEQCVHLPPVRVKGLSVGHQVRVLTNLVQPEEKTYFTFSVRGKQASGFFLRYFHHAYLLFTFLLMDFLSTF